MGFSLGQTIQPNQQAPDSVSNRVSINGEQGNQLPSTSKVYIKAQTNLYTCSPYIHKTDKTFSSCRPFLLNFPGPKLSVHIYACLLVSFSLIPQGKASHSSLLQMVLIVSKSFSGIFFQTCSLSGDQNSKSPRCIFLSFCFQVGQCIF